MLEAVGTGIARQGLQAVRVYDVARTDPSFILRDVWRYQGLVLGAPTYDAGAFPPMEYLLDLLTIKQIKNRVIGIFGNYGWGPAAVKRMRTFAEKQNLDLVEPVVEARFAAKPDDLEACRALGGNMVRRVREAVARP
jgi:flavorubredoxin